MRFLIVLSISCLLGCRAGNVQLEHTSIYGSTKIAWEILHDTPPILGDTPN